MMSVRFDHIEVHVDDINRYCAFLNKLFEGGTYEVISKTGTSMYTSPDDLHIEVKKKQKIGPVLESGFCNPCLRRPDAREFLGRLSLAIERVRETSSGPVYFFKDHEDILWHIKDLPYEHTP